MKRLLLLPLACLPTAWAAVAAFPTAVPVAQDEDIVVTYGQVLEGTVTCRSFVLPRGRLAYVQGDFRVDAKGPISIDGTLVCLPSRPAGDAPNIALLSDSTVFVSGVVHGAAGHSYEREDDEAVGRDGGAGSSILMEGSILRVTGTVVAGAGGQAGRGGNGGRGGAVLTLGRAPNAAMQVPAPFLGVMSGGGGKGGHGDKRVNDGKGGDGGDSGAALHYTTRGEVPEEYRWLLD